MFPKTVHSNCQLAVIWLWLAGRADTVVATRSHTPIWFWPWHFGVVKKRPRWILRRGNDGLLRWRMCLPERDLVYHFKRTRNVECQPWAPFYFEGRILGARLSALRRGRCFLWERPAWQVVPWLIALVILGLPIWMLVSACYWPYWLVREGCTAWSLSNRRQPASGRM